MVSCQVRTGVDSKGERISRKRLPIEPIGILLLNLKSHVKYTTPRSHIGILIIIYVWITKRLFMTLNTYQLSVMYVS